MGNSKFTFTYDVDAVLLQLIYKHREDISHRGTTRHAWSSVLNEFNDSLDASIQQPRTLSNRFKKLRRDLKLRSNYSVALNENDKLLVHLDRFFDQVSDSEKRKGSDVNLSAIEEPNEPFVQIQFTPPRPIESAKSSTSLFSPKMPKADDISYHYTTRNPGPSHEEISEPMMSFPYLQEEFDVQRMINTLHQNQIQQANQINEFQREFHSFKMDVASKLEKILESVNKV